MKTRIWIALASVGLVLAIALALPSLTTARTTLQQGNANAGMQAGQGNGMRNGMGGQHGHGRGQGNQQSGNSESLLAVSAQVLGISQQELLAQLGSDKSIADLAGTKTQVIIDTFVAQKSEQITALVNNGTITQDVADQRIAVMKGMVVGRTNQIWATGVQGRPAGLEPLQQTGQMQGRGRGAGQNHGNGAGQNYTDTNGDGTCDHAPVNQ